MSSPRKKNTLFHFKQFSVRHDRSGMKVGTDGVLLGAWTDVKDAKRILDIGTGTGVIALMMAQRTESDVKISAVEIDLDASADAAENFTSSPWKNRLSLHAGSIQEYQAVEKFDLIVSNPPYFQNSYKPPDSKREAARHTENLSFNNLLHAVNSLLLPTGRFSVILPYTEGLSFIELANQTGYFCTRKWSFKGRIHKPIERWLLEFSTQEKLTYNGEIVLHDTGEEWSDAYKKITQEFYLKL